MENAEAVFNVLLSRRSVRQFLPEPVSRATLEKIVLAGIEAPTGCNEQLKQFIIVDDPAVMDKLRVVSKALTGAPAAIVILIDPKPTPYAEFWIQDASAAMQNMLLAAVAMGLGGCWVEGAVRRFEKDLCAVLNVPYNLRLWSLTPIGRPAIQPERPDKPSLAEVTHYNHFGMK